VASTSLASAYHEKVDRLGFRRRVVPFARTPHDRLRSACRELPRRPMATISIGADGWRDAPEAHGPSRRLHGAVSAVEAARILRRLPAVRVIHAHSLDMAHAFLPAARRRGLPLVVSFHGLKPGGVPQTPESTCRAVFDAAVAVLVNTEFARTQVFGLGADPARTMVLPQGLPLEEFPYTEHVPVAPGAPLELLTVGRLHRDKGQGWALLALRRLRDVGVAAHWHFVGIGPARSRLERLAARLGVAAHVTWHGELTQAPLRALYARCHLFVLPTLAAVRPDDWVETQGVVLQEAQASGCVPIAARVGGIPECIADGDDGVLIEERSHRAIVRAVQALCADPAAWLAMQRAGRCTVERRFAADVIGDRMAALLREVADGGRQRPPVTRDPIPSKV
jgi:glycosyltransferase involved in cell wall biosynthesis